MGHFEGLVGVLLDQENSGLVFGVDGVENWMDSRRIYAADLLEASDEIIRHDSKKLAVLIQDIVFKTKPKHTQGLPSK